VQKAAAPVPQASGVAAGQAQVPFVQACPALQVAPAATPTQSADAPQCARSDWGSMHLPPHSTRPDWQLTWQVPALQTSPDAHVVPAPGPAQLPEAPQKARSVSGSTHVPSQSTRPDWQLTWQVPALQTSPAAQAWPALPPVHAPDAPQCPRSWSGSTHFPSHWTSPAWQETRQAPPEQTRPDAQAFPQPPQFALSVAVLTHVPLHAREEPAQTDSVAPQPARASTSATDDSQRWSLDMRSSPPGSGAPRTSARGGYHFAPSER
jgi:hypothetical protein